MVLYSSSDISVAPESRPGLVEAVLIMKPIIANRRTKIMAISTAEIPNGVRKSES